MGMMKGSGKFGCGGNKVFPKFGQKLQKTAGKGFGKGKGKARGMMKGSGKFGGGGRKVLSKFAQRLQKTAGKGFFKGKGKAARKGRGKGKGGGGDSKEKLELKTIDDTLKVWVGGLEKNVSRKDLQKHFVPVAKPSFTHIYETRSGVVGVVCFESEDDVSTAIATLDGTSLKGSPIEVDAWVKPEREGQTD